MRTSVSLRIRTVHLIFLLLCFSHFYLYGLFALLIITAKLVSDRTGEVTVAVASKSKKLNSWRVSDYTPEYRETRSLGKRKLLTPDEILRLPINEALVIMRGQKVLKVEKYDYTSHPHSKMMIKKKASTHMPEWRRTLEAEYAAECSKSVSNNQEEKIQPDEPNDASKVESIPYRVSFNIKSPKNP